MKLEEVINLLGIRYLLNAEFVDEFEEKIFNVKDNLDVYLNTEVKEIRFNNYGKVYIVLNVL